MDIARRALGELIGHRVKIWQNGSESYYYTEEGVLEAYDHPWLKLASDDGATIYIPAYGVRMMRVAPHAAEEEAAERLDRAA